MKKRAIHYFVGVLVILISLNGCNNSLPVEANTPHVSITEAPAASSPIVTEQTQPDTTINETTIPPPTPSSAPQPTEIQDSDESAKMAKSLFEVGKAVYADALGLSGFSPYFYWVPEKAAILYEGYVRDNENKVISGVYYYDINNGKNKKLIEGQPERNYFFGEPVWSTEGNEVLISFNEQMEKSPVTYVYSLKDENVSMLPITGFDAGFSPDGAKIIYVDTEQSIHIYHRAEGISNPIAPLVKGHSPLWFSDNRHILFLKDTGKNPHGLDGGEHYNLCIMDTQEIEPYKIIGDESVYQNIDWVLQDRFAWIEWGWDDGHYASLLDINGNTVEELGDGLLSKYLTGEKPALIIPHGDVWKVIDIEANSYTEYRASGTLYTPLSLLPDGSLLFWEGSTAEVNRLLSVNHKGYTSILTNDNGYLYPRVSSDGSRLAFIDSGDKYFILTDISTLLLGE